jgi:hypothetical protein
LPEQFGGNEKDVRAWLGSLHFRVISSHQLVKQRKEAAVSVSLQQKGAKKKMKNQSRVYNLYVLFIRDTRYRYWQRWAPLLKK